MYTAINDKKITAIITLDISVTFYTINHSILQCHLQCDFGIAGVVFDWIKSYLPNRKQYVKLGQHCSGCTPCISGVPQGSVLGSILFALCVVPVGDIISAYGIQYHQYADNTQLFFALKAATIDTDIHLLKSCSRAVKRWFLENDLMLNADKSEVTLVGSSAQLRKIDETKFVKVADVALHTVNQIKSLGVIVDSQLTFKAYVNAVAKACNCHIWSFRQIRHLLTKDIAYTLARSIVLSKLDYCNAIMHELPKSSTAVLQ